MTHRTRPLEIPRIRILIYHTFLASLRPHSAIVAPPLERAFRYVFRLSYGGMMLSLRQFLRLVLVGHPSSSFGINMAGSGD